MKYLNELAKIVTRRRVAKVEILDENILKDTNSLYNQFYEGILSGEFKTDEDAAEFFYQTSPLDDRYRKLKSRFKKRLFNNLFYIDINDPTFSDYQRAYYSVNKNYALAKILIGNGARNTFLQLAKRTLKNALKYEMNDVVVLLLREMLYHYALMGNDKAYQEYDELLTERLDIILTELKTEKIYQAVIINLVKGNPKKEEFKNMLEAKIKETNKIIKDYDSYNIRKFAYNTLCLYYQFLNDHEQILKTCEKGEKYFQNHPIKHDLILALLNTFKLEAYLNLRDYEEGNRSAEKALKYFTEGTNNWLAFLEYYFLLAMHTQNYDKAAEIFSTVTNHPRFEYTSPLRQEKWKILEAYLQFIIENEAIDADELEHPLKKFRLYKFLNEVPTYSKDKAGYNAAILIIQVMWLIQTSNYDGLIDRAEAMRMYSLRYLKKAKSQRAYHFIKMLLMAEKRSFEYIKTEKITQKLFKELQDNKDGTVSEWEIIPYDVLWEKALERIEMDN